MLPLSPCWQTCRLQSSTYGFGLRRREEEIHLIHLSLWEDNGAESTACCRIAVLLAERLREF